MAEKVVEETAEKRTTPKQKSEAGEGRHDFIAIRQQFEKLSSGYKAAFRRAASPRDLVEIPGAYRLIPKEENLHAGWQRVLFLLPYITHAENKRLGAALAVKIKEQRLFQVIRSDAPTDLIHLRRICQYASPQADWQTVGEMLFYWGKGQKTRLVEDYLNALRRQSSSTDFTD